MYFKVAAIRESSQALIQDGGVRIHVQQSDAFRSFVPKFVILLGRPSEIKKIEKTTMYALMTMKQMIAFKKIYFDHLGNPGNLRADGAQWQAQWYDRAYVKWYGSCFQKPYTTVCTPIFINISTVDWFIRVGSKTYKYRSCRRYLLTDLHARRNSKIPEPYRQSSRAFSGLL